MISTILLIEHKLNDCRLHWSGSRENNLCVLYSPVKIHSLLTGYLDNAGHSWPIPTNAELERDRGRETVSNRSVLSVFFCSIYAR